MFSKYSLFRGFCVLGLLWTFAVCPVSGAGRTQLPGQMPSVVTQLQAQGRLPATNVLQLALGLPLRNQSGLNQLLADLYNPVSPSYHKFLSSQEFTARFGPTEADYQAVVKFARSNGFKIVHAHPNRLVLDVEASVADVERAFDVNLNLYRHPKENRDFYAPGTEPSVPTNLPVTDMWGLSDFSRPQPLAHRVAPLTSVPLNYNGTGPGGSYRGTDFRNAYAAGSSLVGSGQIIAMAEFDGYYLSDITNYQAQCGYTNVPLQDVLVNGVTGLPGYSGIANAVAEVSLDIELAIAMAPGLSKILVYEGSNPYSVFSKIATDNTAKQISCSWAFSKGPTYEWAHGPGNYTLDAILSQMVAQGQAFFQASGDSDAYTGSQALSSSSGPIPVDSVYVTSVGGTTLTMSGSGTAWSSETVWNWGNNTGSGGGVSPNYTIPSWQTSVSMTANSGSTVNRNIPDVAMTADAVYVIYNNGSTGYFGGTSCAAPLWAGFCSLVNQQSFATSGTTVGFLNPALYAIGAGNNYTNCFHDTTTGNNIGSNTPGLYNAVTNYDLATGLGTPNGVNLINALAPSAPYFLAQPVSRTVTNGANVSFSATANGSAPLSYQWQFNGTNLPAAGNVSGVASNVLSIAAATTNNSGNYRLVVANSFGSVTSSVAVLTVGLAPGITAQPVNLTILTGSNAVFSATASGSSPLTYQWRKNGTNLLNGSGVSGATTNLLTLTAVTTNSSGNYSLYVTNSFGAVTSSVATLTVVSPPAITASSLTNRIAQCGSNNLTFIVTVSGTVPLHYQWSLDGVPIGGATNTSFSLTNLNLPNHPVGVIITNLYGSLVSNTLVTVADTLPPVITLNSTNPFYLELGGTFTDPGATAVDTCAGAVAVGVSGSVNTSVVGTNVLTYTAPDGNGNTNTATRTVVVRDTTPPLITWSFTNLVLAAGTNCSAAMPDVTGTNFILATDLSGALTISQSPTNTSVLQIGTNLVLITVSDASSNVAYSTNWIVVQDQTPPVFFDQPQNQTNLVGETANFSAAASACTPLVWQWFFNDALLNDQTNNALTIGTVTATNAGNYFVVATASGGSSTSAVATLTVTLIPPGINGGIFSFNDGFTLNLTGTPGYLYVLEATTNLGLPGNWLPLATNVLATNGVWQFDDTSATNLPLQFYRLKLAQ